MFGRYRATIEDDMVWVYRGKRLVGGGNHTPDIASTLVLEKQISELRIELLISSESSEQTFIQLTDILRNKFNVRIIASSGPSAEFSSLSFILGDLQERYSLIRERSGMLPAIQWSCIQILTSTPPILLSFVKRTSGIDAITEVWRSRF